MARAGLEPESADDSDVDESFQEDIDALRRACKYTPAIDFSENFADNNDDDDDDDDFELVRTMQQRYGVDVADHDIKPLATLPPRISDDDDDYEYFRSIKQQLLDKDTPVSASPDGAKTKEDSCRHTPVSNDVISAAFGRESVDEHRVDPDQDVYDTTEKEGVFSSASSFPLAAQTFIEAIKKNRSCQKFIRNKLLHVEAKMEQIKELRKRLKTFRDFQVQCKKNIGRALSQKQDARVQLISVHKQRASAKGAESNVSSMCYGPNENSYVSCYKAALEKFPLSFHRDKWSKEDRQNLEKGIVRQYQEKLLHKSGLSSAEQPGYTNEVESVDAMMLSVKNQNITPETIQCFAGKVNWNQLASIYLPRRSGEECETRWLNYENFLINLSTWTREEEMKLLSLIEKNGFHSWKSVAERMTSNRTPYECLAHYQRSLNASILKRAWTVDEDDQLCSAVESFGESNWQAVASVLEGRTGPQCSNRWRKTLNPARKRVGKWSDDEDKRLRVAVALFGKSWHKIAQFVPGRTQVQCRERWVNVLDPSINQSKWTVEEDMKLKKALAEHGYCWSKVAACIPFRTDNQCLRRWIRLCPRDVPRLKAARTMQRIALISNFVDREEERPTLGPKDFVSLSVEGSTNEENGNGTQGRKRKRPRKCKETQSTGKLSSSCSLTRKKRKKSAGSLDNKMIGDSDPDESNYEDTVYVNEELTSKTGSMKCNAKKRIANKHKRQSKSKSRDIVTRSMSRRARGVRSKGSSQDVSRNLCVASDVEFSDKKNVNVSSSKLQSQSECLILTEDNIATERGVPDESTQAHQTSAASSKMKKAKKKHKISKVEADNLDVWEDLPLSVLFKKGVTRTR